MNKTKKKKNQRPSKPAHSQGYTLQQALAEQIAYSGIRECSEKGKLLLQNLYTEHFHQIEPFIENALSGEMSLLLTLPKLSQRVTAVKIMGTVLYSFEDISCKASLMCIVEDEFKGISNILSSLFPYTTKVKDEIFRLFQMDDASGIIGSLYYILAYKPCEPDVQEDCIEIVTYLQELITFRHSNIDSTEYGDFCPVDTLEADINRWFSEVPQLQSSAYFNPYNAASCISTYSGLRINNFIRGSLITKKMRSEISTAIAFSANEMDITKGERIALSPGQELLMYTNISYLMMIRLITKKYVEEQKERIREELFSSNSQSDISTNPAKALRERDKALNLAKSMEAQASEAHAKQASALKREGALQIKLQEAEEKIAAIEKELKEAHYLLDLLSPDDVADDNQENATDEPIEFDKNIESLEYPELLAPLLSKYKVVLVGGNKNLINKLTSRNPDVTCIDRERIGTCESLIRNADYVFLKADSMSHTLFWKCRNLATNSNTPYSFISGTSTVEQNMYETLIEHKNTTEKGN